MVWLSTKAAAELLNYTERTIRKKASDKEYICRYIKSSSGQGGKKMEILLESLPEEAQKAYRNKNGEECQIVSNTGYTSTKKQKESGQLRALAVAEYRKFLDKSMKTGMTKKTEIMALFIRQWNAEHDFKTSSRSLYDWMKRSKSGNAEKLIDRRGGYNRGQSSIPKIYMEKFDSLYLQQTKPTIESCFNEVKLEADLNGDCIPGIKAFRNHVKNMNTALLILAREGQKAFDDKCMPYTERDYSRLVPNEFWVSDHHLWDIFVRVPDGKGGWKLERPWGSYWMDMRTRKVMSFIIRTEPPNSDVVLCSFGLGVKRYGIPYGVRLDNGKDYKARDLFYPEGHYILQENEQECIFNSLATNLQIKVTYAIPYNAKAKPIERLFNTFEKELAKKYPSYAGSDAKQRPEELKNLNIENVITLEEFIEQHSLYVEKIYNETAHSGDAMYGKSPNQAYADIPFTVRRATEEVLYFSLMRVKGKRVIDRNGITFKGVHFYNENCINHLGEKVLARYDPTKPEILYVFDLNENFLFIAEKMQKMGWALTDEDYRKEGERKKRARQNALNSYSANNDVRTPEAIGERLKREAESIQRAPAAKPKKFELVRNDKLEENGRRLSMTDMDRNYSDACARIEAKKKAGSDKQKELAGKFKKKMLEREKMTRKQA